MPDDAVLQLIARANVARHDNRGDTDAEQALERTFVCSQRLVVYGTLAPGEANHHLLADCRGTWSPATVHGRRGQRDFPVFTYAAEARAVRMHLLTSDLLPEHWPELDAFEGLAYRRILVPVHADGRLLTVANLYAAVRPVEPT